MKTTLKIIVAILIAGLYTLQTKAQAPEGKPEPRPQKIERPVRPNAPKPMRSEVIPGLTEDQKEKIKSIKFKVQKEALALKNTIGEKKAKLRTLTTLDKADLSEINKVIDDMAALKASMMKIQEAARQEIRKLLNDEQRLRFDLSREKIMKAGVQKEKLKKQEFKREEIQK